MSVIYHGIKNSMQLDHLESELKLSGSTIVKLSDEYPAVAFSLPLSPEEVLIVEHLASPSSIERLLALKVLTRTELLMTLYFLYIVELVTFFESFLEQQVDAGGLDQNNDQSQDASRTHEPKAVLEQTTSDYLKQFAGTSTGLKNAQNAIVIELVDRFGSIHNMNYYEILGLDSQTFDEAKATKAFTEITRKFHPSNLGSSDKEAARLAEIVLAKANEAYSTLSKPGPRAEYDSTLRSVQERKRGRSVVRSGEAELEFQKGDFFLRKGDFRSALTYLRRAVEISGDEADYLAAYGWGLFNDQDQPKEMREQMGKRYLRRAVSLNPSCARAFIHLASIARIETRIDDAWKLLDEASKLGTENELIEAEHDKIEFLGSRPIKPAYKGKEDEERPKSGLFSGMLGKKKTKP